MRHKLNSDKTPAELTPLPIVEGVDTIKKKSTLLQVIPSHKKPTYWYNVSGYRYDTTEMLPAGILLLWLSSHQINTLIFLPIDKWCSCGLLATAEGQQLSLGRGWEGAQESQQVYRTGECAHANMDPGHFGSISSCSWWALVQVILYNTRGLHRKALELLSAHSSREDSPLQGTSRTVTYVQVLKSVQTAQVYNALLPPRTWVLST